MRPELCDTREQRAAKGQGGGAYGHAGRRVRRKGEDSVLFKGPPGWRASLPNYKKCKKCWSN